MKKSMIIVAALALVSLTSCKKERTCSCTSSTVDAGTSYSVGSGGQNSNTYSNTGITDTDEIKYSKISKSNAEQSCPESVTSVDNYDNTTTVGSYISGSKGAKTTTTKCEIK